VEGFLFVAQACIGNSTGRQNAIDVQNQQFNGLAAVSQRGRHVAS
jgi:hypothetical protein